MSTPAKRATKTMNRRDSLMGTAITREMGSAGQAAPCPATEEIAALVDGTITGTERDRLLGHLAECGKCRRIFLAARELTHGEPAAEERRRHAVPPLLAIAATILIVLTLTLTMRGRDTNGVRVAQREPGHAAAGPADERPAATGAAKRPEPSRTAPTPSHAPAAPALPAAPAEPLVLLSAREAALPGSRSFGFATAPQQDGPVIAVENLDIQEGTPFPLTVSFTPREGTPVNIDTLKLECLKITPIDLTPRILPHASREGVRIDSVSLPSGSYRFRVSIGDVNGRFSEKEFTVNVSGTF